MTVILLAAGLSSRMGTNKLLLPLGGKPVLLHAIHTALSFSPDVIVVTGHERDRVEALIEGLPVRAVFAKDYAKGQGFSMREGLQAAPYDDFALVPGDLPLLTLQDYSLTKEALQDTTIARPSYNGVPGHPVMFSKKHRERLITFPGRFKSYVDAHDPAIVPGSPGCVLDADTPEGYRKLVSLHNDLSTLEREPQRL